MTIKSAQQPLPYIAKITLLDTIRRKMDELDAGLPIALRNPLAPVAWTGVPTGVCEYVREDITNDPRFIPNHGLWTPNDPASYRARHHQP